MASEAGAVLVVGGLEHHFLENKRFGIPYALRLVAFSLTPGWFEAAVIGRRHEPMETAGISDV